MAREIHVHVPAGLAEDQVIHIHLDNAPQPQQQQQPGQDASADSTVEGMLASLATRPSASPDLREFVAALEKLGYTMGVPKMRRGDRGREKYLRIHDPAARAHDAGYLRAGSLVLTRKDDREKLAAVPGAIVHGSGVRFVLDEGHALEAAKLAKRH
jgi:hypothetical protein